MTENSSEIREFFIVVPPGLEGAAMRELSFWSSKLRCPLGEPTLAKGGVAFRYPLSLGFELNRLLKIPVRILLRLEAFRCRDFNKLFKKVSSLPWNQYVGAEIVWQASAKGSRVKIESRIVETCEKAFLKYRKGHEPKKREAAGEATVYVRFADDVCHLSLDLSGEALYKRGIKRKISRAPIRENLAAGLLWTMWDGEVQGETSGEAVLIDPMMGTGTFLIEGLTLFTPVRSRDFSYERMGVRKDGGSLGSEERLPRLFKHVYGFDRDPEMVFAARENLKSFGGVSLDCKDVFDGTVEPIADGVRWVVVNPPYDRRLQGDGRGRGYYERLISVLAAQYRPDKLGVIVPRVHSSGIEKGVFFESLERHEFENGGFPVAFLLFRK